MDTTAKGDAFEDICFDLIKKAIDRGELPVSKHLCRVFRKQKYLNRDGRQIIFDIAIEVWAPKAKRYSQLILVECKDHRKKPEIGDIQKFGADVKDVAELNGKAVFISRSGFTENSKQHAEKRGMMLIHALDADRYEVILHKQKRSRKMSAKKDETQIFFENLFRPESKNNRKVPYYSKIQLNHLASKVRSKVGISQISPLNTLTLPTLIEYFEQNRGLKFDFSQDVLDNNEHILGNYNSAKDLITIKKGIVQSPRFAFILCHELGHSILHKHLDWNQEDYEDMDDSMFNIFTEKYSLSNPKQWIEWQANAFATSILLPNDAIPFELIQAQNKLGIRRPGRIYVDRQQTNRIALQSTIRSLALTFNVTPTVIEYKLAELGLIEYEGRKLTMGELLEEEIRKLL